MDFGNASKPAPPGTGLVIPRSDTIATVGSVAVDLSPEKTVQSAQAGEAVRVDIRQRDRRAESDEMRVPREARPAREDADASVESRLVIEQQTKTVVIQRRDRNTGEVVELVPDEATLKLRIYNRQQLERDRAGQERRFERTA